MHCFCGYKKVPILKVSVTNLQGFSDQLLYDKVDFRASNFGATLELQIEAKQKMLCRSVAFGVKSVEKKLLRKNIFELATPSLDIFQFSINSPACRKTLFIGSRNQKNCLQRELWQF